MQKKTLYQWDLNQRLVIDDYPAGTEAHFINRKNGTLSAPESTDVSALVVEAYAEGGKVYADIPNSLLQTAGELLVYIYTENGKEAHTARRTVLPIIARPKPADYVYTETEVKRWETLASTAEQALQAANEAVSAAKQIVAGKDGYTPVRGVDYWTDDDISAIQADNIACISAELAKRGQVKPEFAGSIDECTDTAKLYVLPDGYIYAYVCKKTTEEVANYTNRLPISVNTDGTVYVGDNGEKGYRVGYRLNSSGTEAAYENVEVIGFIPVKLGDVIRFKNITFRASGGGAYANQEYLSFYDANKNVLSSAIISYSSQLFTDSNTEISERDSTTYDLLVLDTAELINWDHSNNKWTAASDMAYFRISAEEITADSIITINEEIKNASVVEKTEYAWTNTGHAFVPADYEDRIVDLEEEVANHTESIQNMITGSDIPDHVITEAEDVIDKVITAQGNRTFTFAAITDLHYGNAGYTDGVKHACQAMKYIDERIRLDAVAVLGDYTDGYPADGYANAIGDFRAINKVLTDLRFAPNMRVQGNHDYYADHTAAVNRHISAFSDDVVWGSVSGGYFYRDFEGYQLRVICLNTTETGNANVDVSAAQYQWFANSLDLTSKEDAEDWQILILSHHPLDWYDADGVYSFAQIVNAYRNGTSWSNSTLGISCDYTHKNTATLIGNIHGHIHNLLTDYVHIGNVANGNKTTVLRMCTPEACINRSNQYTDAWHEETSYPKTINTAEDTSFVVYCIDLDTHNINAICYGAGYDREINY